jgi:segregation and condensation protein A
MIPSGNESPSAPSPPAEAGASAPAATAPPPGDAAAGPVELDLGYRVDLEAFSGPLDLLLFLVRRAEVDLADIPVATIADQFIAAVASWQEMDLEVAGDFILMAASLLELKCRMVAPPVEGEAAGEEADEEILDPRAELVRQLLAYRRFKEAMRLLTELEEGQNQTCPRQFRELVPEDPDEIDGIDLANCDPGLLFMTWERVLARINGLGPRTVINDDVPLEVKINALIDAMRAAREARLSWLFGREGSRIGRVGTMLATLECVRQRFLEAIQHEQYGEVTLRYREDEERVPATVAPTPTDMPAEEPKRHRRRIPLITWQAGPGQGAETDTAEAEGEMIEELVETDEQRFLRELEEACAVEAVLTRTADIEASFAAFLAARRLEAGLAAGAVTAAGPGAPMVAVGTAASATTASAGASPA